MSTVETILAQRAASGLDPNVRSWSELAAVETAFLPLPIVKIWVESETGMQRTTRLLASTEATNTDNGVQRPNDYGPLNQRVWFAAGL